MNKQKTTNDNNNNDNDNNNDTTMTTATEEGPTPNPFPYRIPKPDVTESEEENLLASSQETIKSASGSTNHSTPGAQAGKHPYTTPKDTNQSILPEKPSTSKAAGSTNHSSLVTGAAKADAQPNGPKRKKKKSAGQIMKNRYQRAVYMLEKMSNTQATSSSKEPQVAGKTSGNKPDGGPDELKTAEYFRKVVEEYESFLSKKRSADTNRTTAESQKRNRSYNSDILNPAKKSKQTTTTDGVTHRHFSEVARDHLQVTIVDSNSKTPTSIQQKWVEIEVKLSSLVMDHVLDCPAGPHPVFDSSEHLRGYRVIKCADQASLDFLTGCVSKISEAIAGLKLGLIPASDIPRRPRARVWLPPLERSGEKLLECLKLQNKHIPGIDDWLLIKVEEPNKTSRPILLAICEDSIEALKRENNRLKFCLRAAKIKIFQGDKNPEEDDTEEVDDAGLLLEGVSINDEPKN